MEQVAQSMCFVNIQESSELNMETETRPRE